MGILLSLAVAASLLSGCGSSDNTGSTGADNSAAQLESTEGGENMAAADNEAAAQAIADRKAEAEKQDSMRRLYLLSITGQEGRPALIESRKKLMNAYGKPLGLRWNF